MKILVDQICWAIIGTLFTFLISTSLFLIGIVSHPVLALPISTLLAGIGMMVIQYLSAIGGTLQITRHWILPSVIGTVLTIHMIGNSPILDLLGFIVALFGYIGAVRGIQVYLDMHRNDDKP